MKRNVNRGAAWLVVLLAPLPLLAQTNFVKITNAPPVTDLTSGTGCAWVDYDQDGYLDLFVANWAGNNRLYHNQRDGTFLAVTNGAIVNEGASESYGAAWGDYDNNGYPDLFVGNGYSSGRTNFLYRNNGDGTFTKITAGAIVGVSGHFSGCAWADYDRDGFLDLFVANDLSGASVLYHNNRDGTFARINSAPTVTSDAVGAAWADFNNDGWPDLFIANGYGTDFKANFLYANLDSGALQRVTGTNFPSASLGSCCLAWGDYDNDGFADVFVTSSGNNPEPNQLYHNNGNGSFTRVTTGSIVTDQGYSISAAWGDYDNDGYLDLFVGNRNGTRNYLYHNNGNGTFTKITTGAIVTVADQNGGCAWGDYDNDGFLDLFVSNLDPANSGSGHGYLYHNTGNSNAWLKVRCVGTVSNRSAIGAKVRVKATIGGKTFWQLREITSGDGIGSAALIAHFGLGDATNVDTLRIEWPSGAFQEEHNLAARQFLTVTEPPRLLASITNGFPQFSLKGGRGFQYDIEASTDLATWSPAGTVTITNLSGTAQVIDTNAPSSSRRFYRAVSH